MALEPGSRLGVYEIVAPLTATSADAYKALDSSRNRTVAIRLLPSGIVSGAERDLQSITTLNHPHISVVYEVGQHEDRAYLVTEYLEGETLAQRLSRGPLDLETALKAAIALADA